MHAAAKRGKSQCLGKINADEVESAGCASSSYYVERISEVTDARAERQSIDLQAALSEQQALVTESECALADADRKNTKNT
jgi:hypothetical protein